MIDYAYKDLFSDDSTSKQLIIQYEQTTITNEDLFDQTFTLTESLCSGNELRFGECKASRIEFKVANIVAPMSGKELTVKMSLNGYTDEFFVVGKYKVTEDKLTADKQWREIVAYDAIHTIINTDVADWYNTILPNADSTVTMQQFRTSFINHFGLEQEEITLVNDDMIVERTIAIVASTESDTPTESVSVIGEALSGKDVINAICEINGCFGHIGRDGKFHYIYLTQKIEGLYPSTTLYPSPNLFPREVKTVPVGAGGTYISADYKDFKTQSIAKLQIRQEKNDIGVIVGSDGNEYIIENNFLVYGKGSEELTTIANNILSKITGIVYRPIVNVDTKGNPCLEVGDPIRLSTKHALIETYILQRTLKGIQALRDNYSANGVERYAEKVNGVHASIKQLKGKANILERTIEKTLSEIKDIESGLSSKIEQTAKDITAEVTRAKAEEGTLSGKIKVNADNITAEVTRAKAEEGKLSSSISVNAEAIKLKVAKGDISSEISQEAGEIAIKANRISITSDKFKLTKNGSVECSDIKITGGSLYTENTDGSFVKIEAGKITCGKNGIDWESIISTQIIKSGACTTIDAKTLWLKSNSLLFGYSGHYGYTGNLKTALETVGNSLYVHNGMITLS